MRRFPRRPTLLTKNVEGDEGKNDKQHATQQKKRKEKKITGDRIAKWIKTNYIRRNEEFDARITKETSTMMEQQTRKAPAAATIVHLIE